MSSKSGQGSKSETSQPPILDLAPAREILRAMRPGDYVLCFINAKNGAPAKGPRVDPAIDSEWASAAERIIELNRVGWNVFFTVNPVVAEFSGVKPSKSDVSEVCVLYADFDLVAAQIKHAGYPEARSLLHEYGQAFMKDFPPTAAIDSGNGLQLFWSLETALPAKNGGEAEAYMKQLKLSADRFENVDADNVQNIDRLMRLPGTLNWPSKTKIESKGYPEEPRMSSVLVLEADRKIDLKALEAQPEPPTKSMKPKRKSRAKTRRAENDGTDFDTEVDRLKALVTWPPAEASDELIKLHECALGDSFYNHKVNSEGERSERLLSLAIYLRPKLKTDDINDFGSLIAHIGGDPWGHLADIAAGKSEAAAVRALARAFAKAPAKQCPQWDETFDPFHRYSVPDFPLNALPEPLKIYVEAQAENTGVAPGAVAMSTLVAVASAAGTNRRVRIYGG